MKHKLDSCLNHSTKPNIVLEYLCEPVNQQAIKGEVKRDVMY